MCSAFRAILREASAALCTLGNAALRSLPSVQWMHMHNNQMGLRGTAVLGPHPVALLSLQSLDLVATASVLLTAPHSAPTLPLFLRYQALGSNRICADRAAALNARLVVMKVAEPAPGQQVHRGWFRRRARPPSRGALIAAKILPVGSQHRCCRRRRACSHLEDLLLMQSLDPCGTAPALVTSPNSASMSWCSRCGRGSNCPTIASVMLVSECMWTCALLAVAVGAATLGPHLKYHFCPCQQ
jgi:hypothetical protein